MKKVVSMMGAMMAMSGMGSVFGITARESPWPLLSDFGAASNPRWVKRHGNRSVSAAQAKRKAKKRKNIAKRSK